MPLIYTLKSVFYKAVRNPDGSICQIGDNFDTHEEAAQDLRLMLAQCPTMKNQEMLCIIEEACDEYSGTFHRLH